jgi:nucleoside-diphosphate-sugar epimerase
MKRYIVTCGAGFIGSHLVEKIIENGDYPIIIDNSKENDRKNLSHLDSTKFQFINLDLSKELVHDSVIYLTDGVFDLSINNTIYLRSFSKINEKYYNKFIECNLFNVYGERQDINSGIISKLINQSLNNKPSVIYGSGSQIRDFIYVKDVVNYLYSMMEFLNKNETYFCDKVDICTGVGNSELQLAIIINKLINDKQCDIRFEKQSSKNNPVIIGSTSKLDNFKFNIKRTELIDGLTKTIDWYRSNK